MIGTAIATAALNAASAALGAAATTAGTAIQDTLMTDGGAASVADCAGGRDACADACVPLRSRAVVAFDGMVVPLARLPEVPLVGRAVAEALLREEEAV